MARRRKLNWQFEAQQDRKGIFQYWNKKNKSKEYSKRLNQLFRTKTEALKDFPYNGHTTNLENVRVLVIEKYLLYLSMRIIAVLFFFYLKKENIFIQH